MDTFLKIVTKCRTEFGQERLGVKTTWTVVEVLDKLPAHISDLSEDAQVHVFCVFLPYFQVQTFYEGVGVMISAHPVPVQGQLIIKLMDMPNRVVVSTASFPRLFTSLVATADAGCSPEHERPC